MENCLTEISAVWAYNPWLLVKSTERMSDTCGNRLGLSKAPFTSRMVEPRSRPTITRCHGDHALKIITGHFWLPGPCHSHTGHHISYW